MKMRKTYAYNSIIIGVLLAMLAYASTNSAAIAVLTGLAVSVIGFIAIRLIENGISRGVDKAADKITEAYKACKKQKAAENGTYGKTGTTQMPNR